MCYDFEIPEKVKQKSRNVLDKEDQEIELEIGTYDGLKLIQYFLFIFNN